MRGEQLILQRGAGGLGALALAHRLLTRDRETGGWRWQAEAIERAGVTDNVGELLTAKIDKLSPAARRVLSLAACAGASFEAALLGEAEGLANAALEAAVEELSHEGLIVALGDAESSGHAFVHDRVQQAAYEAIAADARPASHLGIARAIERRHGKLEGDAELFAALYHYLRALPLLVSREDRRHVAELCLRGGQRAKLGSAYAEAADFLRAGRELLGEEGWQAHPSLTLDTHLTLGEASWLAGHPEVGEPLLELCRARAEGRLAFNPGSFRHMKLLVDATEARAEARHEEAARLYDEAIEAAHRSGFVNSEALGLRMAGELYLALGRARLARAYLRDAHDAYTRWGAHAVAASLRQRYPDFFGAEVLGEPAPERRARGSSTTSSTSTTVGALNSRIDAAAVLRATQALAGDMVLSSLVGRVLRLLTENAGAERAALALVRDGELRVAAQLTLEPETLETSLDEPVAGSLRLPSAVVQYVARSREPVVLGQATVDNRFDEDPYLRARSPASVLAVPLEHQGRLSGVMYLEQPRVANAFPEARVELCSLLASQAATAMENATLYAEVQRKTEALLLSNERLERQVLERTAQLRAAKEVADAANQAKSDFLASMSHELRTPLNSILGYGNILERMLTQEPRARDGLRVIRASAEHLLTLINDVLDLAKIEAGKMELLPKYVNLSTFARTAANLCRVRAEQKGLSFTYEIEGAALVGVRADERRLMQVVLNLLGNAIKFTERGRVHFTASVLEEEPGAAECRAPRRTVRFRVEDTGPGIAPEHLARIFEPFEQVGDQRARTEGTGLGLSICKRIVALMEGRIEVESEVGKGSVFTVTLRLPEAVSEVGAEDLGWESIVGYRGERRALLVVDDSAENRAVLRDLITPIGFEVIEAEDGEQALRLAAERRPALIVMDVAMPGMDGYEVTRRLRRDPALAGVVIIASSASVSEAEVAKSKAAGCDDFLPKPVHIDALLAQLARHLGVEWIRAAGQGGAGGEGVNAGQGAGPVVPPSAEERARLLEMAQKGSVRGLLQELQRLEEQDGRLGPWIAQLRALVRGFQLKAAQAFLEA